MHIYGLQKLIRERDQDRLVNVEYRNSVRQAVDRLARDGCVEIAGVRNDGPGPRRTVYRITERGRTQLISRLRDAIAIPRREYPTLPVAISLLPHLDPATATRCLAQRRAALNEERAALSMSRSLNSGGAQKMPLENDLIITLMDAELAWIERLQARISATIQPSGRRLTGIEN